MDLNSIFRVSQKLYGRSEQVAVLLSAFDRVSQNGRVELVLVSGYSGIGQSSTALHTANGQSTSPHHTTYTAVISPLLCCTLSLLVSGKTSLVDEVHKT